MTSPRDDLPPAFPEWLRRMFPTLRVEDTNALFQAFRRRRVLHGFLPTKVLRGVFSTRGTLVLCLVACALVAAAPIFQDPFEALEIHYLAILLPVYLVAVVALMIEFGTTRHRYPSNRPMRWVSEIFSIKGHDFHGARELWMTGATGRDVIEATLLEHVERHWRTLLILPFIAGSLVFQITLVALGKGRHADALVPGFVILVLACIGARVLITAYASAVCDEVLEPLIAHWRRRGEREAGPGTEHGNSSSSGSEPVSSIILVGMVVAGTIFLLSTIQRFVITVTSAESAVAKFIDAHSFAITAVVLGIEIAFVLSLLGRHLPKRAETTLARLLREAEYPFEVQMAVVLSDDPDAEKWAIRRAMAQNPAAAELRESS